METVNWALASGCTNLGGGCESCPSLWEYKDNGWDYSLKTHPAVLSQPGNNPEPTVYTVALGSDLFHEAVPDEFIRDAFKAMNENYHHYFEIATKRAERMESLGASLNWTGNIAAGVTVEDEDAKWRIDHLRRTPAFTRFVSFLPLLGEVGSLNLEGIHMAVVGAEEWGLKRPCQEVWVQGINKRCESQGVELLNKIRTYEGVNTCQE